MSCCPWLDIVFCSFALLLSICAFCLRPDDRRLEVCCPGFRENLSGSMHRLLIFLDWNEWILIPVNTIAAFAIFFSNFECESGNSRCASSMLHAFTSSRMLCVLQTIALTSFVLQLFASEFLVAWTGVFYLLNHMCVYHKEFLPQAQQLIMGVSQQHSSSSSSWTSMFNPISMRQFEGNLNLQEYCLMLSTYDDPKLFRYVIFSSVEVPGGVVLFSLFNGTTSNVPRSEWTWHCSESGWHRY
ncbi:unnamed protein product [Durusdinium trenchii]|uniref:Uncharacterized protein n=1 Tax=Durusdinium trenchii TaxID=1381693 RepID=A0ABP0RC83_9DINO